MKAIQLEAPTRFRRIEIDAPARPNPNQALVRTHTMGICGTDVSCYLGKFPFFDYPRIPGHELGVEVLAVGDGVTNVAAGDRCSVEPYLNCGSCFACKQGCTNCCECLKVIGVMMDGGLCDQFLIPANKLHPSAKLSYDQLALIETLAIGCHATNRAIPTGDDRVLIIGAGPIGLATLEFMRLAGPEITVMDISAARLEFCRESYGVTKLVEHQQSETTKQELRQHTAGEMYSIVVDATGNDRSMSEALEYVAHTGTLVYVGITTEAISFPHPQLHRREMTIKASRNAVSSDFTRIIQLIEDQTIDTTPWVTHRTCFDRVADDFPEFLKPESGVIKALIAVQ